MRCEDFALAYRSRSQDFGCAVLADGAGSKRNSQVGAEAACTVTASILKSLKETILADPIKAGALVLSGVRSQIDHLASVSGEPFDQFGSTLLFSSIYFERGSWYTFSGQLGDGVVVLDNSSEQKVQFRQVKGIYVNETVFTTSDSPEKHLQIDLRCETRPIGFLLASDGVAQNLVDMKSEAPSNACAEIFSWVKNHRQDVIQRAVQSNLEGIFRENSFDDISMALVATVR